MKIVKKEPSLHLFLIVSCAMNIPWTAPSTRPIDVPTPPTATLTGHFLYVATPGIRDYLGYGGHGLLVFDIDNDHKFVKRIGTKGFHEDGTPSNVKGIAVSAALNSVYISTLESVQRIDLARFVQKGWIFPQSKY